MWQNSKKKEEREFRSLATETETERQKKIFCDKITSSHCFKRSQSFNSPLWLKCGDATTRSHQKIGTVEQEPTKNLVWKGGAVAELS